MSENFSETVKQINAQLRSFGFEAVQQVMFKDRDGKVIGQVSQFRATEMSRVHKNPILAAVKCSGLQ